MGEPEQKIDRSTSQETGFDAAGVSQEAANNLRHLPWAQRRAQDEVNRVMAEHVGPVVNTESHNPREAGPLYHVHIDVPVLSLERVIRQFESAGAECELHDGYLSVAAIDRTDRARMEHLLKQVAGNDGCWVEPVREMA